MIVGSQKIDSETNTEEEKYEHENNNNYHSDDGGAFKYENCGFESDEKEPYDLREDESPGHNCIVYLNESEPPHKSVNNMENIAANAVSFTNQNNNCVPNHESESESECYSTSSCEIEQPPSINSSRSSSSSSHYNGFGGQPKVVPNSHIFEMTNSELKENPNDSWDEAVVPPTSTALPQNTISNQLVQQVEPEKKPIPASSIIPKFFPQSFDFHEKMKTLKRNMDLNSGQINTKAPSVDVVGRQTQPEKRSQLVDITDKEASRISKIFGIGKS